jgi:hypothetical protein
MIMLQNYKTKTNETETISTWMRMNSCPNVSDLNPGRSSLGIVQLVQGQVPAFAHHLEADSAKRDLEISGADVPVVVALVAVNLNKKFETSFFTCLVFVSN